MLSLSIRIILFFLAIHVIVEALAAYILLKNKDEMYDRARKYITAFFITSSVASLAEIIMVIATPLEPNAYRLIDTQVILCGFLIFALLMFYCVELLRPHWLNAKRIFYIMLPWLLLVVALIIGAVYDKQILVIHTIEQLCENLFQPDVFIRLLLVLLFVPYAIWLFVIDFNWRYSSVSRKTTNIIVAMTMILCFTYIGSRGLQLFYAYIAHEFIYISLTVFLVRLECTDRFHRATQQHNPAAKPQMLVSESTMGHLAHALDEVINDPDVWQNPDLTIDDIAKIVGTNRTYLQMAAKQKGYMSVMDMIHHVRIEYVCQQLRTVESPQIQNIFYDAGYRSRTTAWRNFVNIMGCTPTEFEKTWNFTPLAEGEIK
ncbi:MAG: helix-turn-helix domain-containing protein [Paludibacteraceae bacterium]|nr:helix-turn-helix domain-containing protein [Paludibacteraceae bacterium]